MEFNYKTITSNILKRYSEIRMLKAQFDKELLIAQITMIPFIVLNIRHVQEEIKISLQPFITKEEIKI